MYNILFNLSNFKSFIDLANYHFKDQTVVLANVEFQSEIDSGTPTPKIDPFQITQSNSNTMTDSTLTITPGKVCYLLGFYYFCLSFNIKCLLQKVNGKV